MRQYTNETRMKQNKNHKAYLDRKRIIIIVAAVLAVMLIVGSLITVCYVKNKKAKETFAPVVETESQTVEVTEAPVSETVTEMVGDVSVEQYTATMYATTVTLNVRSQPNSSSQILGQVGQDTGIVVTGKCSNGWMRIDFNGGVGYCSADYLTGAQNQSDAPYMIKVNRKQNIVIVYSKDQYGGYTTPYKAMVCSVGLDGATPTGSWTTTDKYVWRLLSGNVYGQYATRISGHYLFHSVPYFTQSKSDLEYDEYNKLGQAASLGCIRLSVADAKWIYDNCPSGTTVTIYDSDAAEPLAKPTATRIDTNDSRKGWDPTDPDSNNPW